ncbi:MAG: hypothetical protein FJ137_12260 [Deltaproteobacteria bacterium]|nr:hypothetical protein [Deltaproteobacteria bacterium]
MVAATSSSASAAAARAHPTTTSGPTSHTRTVVIPQVAPPASLAPADRAALVAAVRTATVVPPALLREPAVAALADEARRTLARATGRIPADVEVDVRVLPGAGDRVLVFRERSGRQVTLPAGDALSSGEAKGIGAALADLNVIAGLGLGFRVMPGVFSVGSMATASRFNDRDGVVAHLRIGASSTVGGAAYVWQLDGGPRPVGPTVAVAAPFVSTERDPLVGDKLELSIPGYVTVFAAVKRGESKAPDIGWLGVVWHQGLFGHGPGPTMSAKLVVGHPALAAPLAPVFGGAAAVLSPVMARLQALQHALQHGQQHTRHRGDEPARG